MKDAVLTALSNVLTRKRSERLAEEVRIQKVLEACKKDKSLAEKGLMTKYHDLSKEIKLIEEAMEVANDKG